MRFSPLALLVTMVLLLLSSGCNSAVTDAPAGNVFGSAASLIVTESRPQGDTAYTIAVAKFWDSGSQTNAVEVNNVTVDGVQLTYSPAERLYRADTNSFNSSLTHSWEIVGKGEVPSASATVVQPPLIKLTSPSPAQSIKQGEDLTIRWSPVIAGSDLFLQLVDSNGNVYSAEPIDDGEFIVSRNVTASFRLGVFTVSLYRQNLVTKTVDGKDMTFNGESKAILKANLVP